MTISDLRKRIADVERVSILVRLLVDKALENGFGPRDVVIALLSGAAYVAVKTTPRIDDVVALAAEAFNRASRKAPS